MNLVSPVYEGFPQPFFPEVEAVVSDLPESHPHHRTLEDRCTSATPSMEEHTFRTVSVLHSLAVVFTNLDANTAVTD